MSEIPQGEKTMINYEQKFWDIIRIYSISKDQLEDLLDDKKTVDQLFEKNDKYIQADNEFAKIRLESEIAELKKLKNKV